MPQYSRKTLIKEVKRVIASRRSQGIRYRKPFSEKQLDRIHELRAYGPLPVRSVDIDLAWGGWVEIYDDAEGNESVDYTHPCSMEAADKLERAEEEFHGKARPYAKPQVNRKRR